MGSKSLLKMYTFVFILIALLIACTNQSINVPIIRSVELVDKNGNLLPVTDGWINLQANSIIRVSFDGAANYIEYYTEPTGTEVLLEQRIIGADYIYKKGERTAQFEWEVPYGFLGDIWVVVYNGDIARTSHTSEFFIKAIYE